MRSLSYTSISAYLRCPLYFKHRYISRLPERPRGEYILGNSLHAALEFFYSGEEAPTLDAFLDMYRSNWVSEGFMSPEQEDEMFRAGERWLRAFHSRSAHDYVRPLYVERRFEVELDGVILRGTIDRVDRLKDGGIEVVDYKSGEVSLHDAETSLQLSIYQYAAAELSGRPVRRLTLFHIPTMTRYSVPSRTDREIQALRLEIQNVVRGISRRRFEPRRNERCPCDYAGTCTFYRHLYLITRKRETLPDMGFISGQVDAYSEMLLEGECMKSPPAPEREALMRGMESEFRRFMHSYGFARIYGSRFALELKGGSFIAEEITPREREEIS